MKKLFSVKYLTTILFILIIGFFYFFSIKPMGIGLLNFSKELISSKNAEISSIENDFIDYYQPKNHLVTFNGGLKRLIGRNYVNDTYRLENGQLLQANYKYDISEIASNTVEFEKYLESKNIPMLYVQIPNKNSLPDGELPAYIPDYSKENTDNFLSVLKENNINILDLRKREKELNLNHFDLFIPTDHHWKAEAGFWAFNEITDRIAEMDESFKINPEIKKESNYSFKTYENVFIGSCGRRVGRWYSPEDDYTIITPKFDTHVVFSAESDNMKKEGTFEEAFINMNKLFEDGMVNENYETYCGKLYDVSTVKNKSVSEGLNITSTDKKILLLTDSFDKMITPFLSLGYSDVCSIDLRLYTGSLKAYIESYKPDIIIVSYNPGDYKEDHSRMFNFE